MSSIRFLRSHPIFQSPQNRSARPVFIFCFVCSQDLHRTSNPNKIQEIEKRRIHAHHERRVKPKYVIHSRTQQRSSPRCYTSHAPKFIEIEETSPKASLLSTSRQHARAAVSQVFGRLSSQISKSQTWKKIMSLEGIAKISIAHPAHERYTNPTAFVYTSMVD